MSWMIYFAYGSNLNLRLLSRYLANHGVDADELRNSRPAILPDHKLRTNYLSIVHNAGACNIEPSPGHAVEGVIMEITESVREGLRIKEGWLDWKRASNTEPVG